MVERRHRFGLRTRLTTALALVVMAAAFVIGIGTMFGVRATLLADLEERAVDQSLVNARLVAATLRADDIDETAILAALRPPVRSRPLLWTTGGWYSASLQVADTDVPEEMRRRVIEGESLMQRTTLEAGPVLAVGIPVDPGEAAYFELFEMTTIEDSLSALARSLLIVGASATLAGAFIGRWVSGRVLRPVGRVSEIAGKVASGALDARLDQGLDPDLAGLARSFNLMADSLADRIAREARFASDVSHELRSPVTTLVTAVSVLERRRHELSDEGAEALDLMSADVRRLQQTVVDLLEMTRHDAGMVEVELELMTVGEAVKATAARIGNSIDHVVVEPSAVGATVAVDLRRLERVMANFVANAETHGGGVTRIRVTAGRDHVLIGVEDEGPGIPPHEVELIFDRFARGAMAGRRRSTDGTGLGLALASENARLLGGRVFVDPERRRGARLVLELPLVSS